MRPLFLHVLTAAGLATLAATGAPSHSSSATVTGRPAEAAAGAAPLAATGVPALRAAATTSAAHRAAGVSRAAAAARAAAARAAALRAAALRAAVEQRRRELALRASRSRRTALPAAPAGPPEVTGSPQAMARALLAQRGQSDQFGCLDRLWTRESGWRVSDTNASSGAYGIPQSLPASKMASAGADWRTNPLTQIRWGLGYIADRYGSPCVAWAHSQAHNWY